MAALAAPAPFPRLAPASGSPLPCPQPRPKGSLQGPIGPNSSEGVWGGRIGGGAGPRTGNGEPGRGWGGLTCLPGALGCLRAHGKGKGKRLSQDLPQAQACGSSPGARGFWSQTDHFPTLEGPFLSFLTLDLGHSSRASVCPPTTRGWQMGNGSERRRPGPLAQGPGPGASCMADPCSSQRGAPGQLGGLMARPCP